MMNIPFLSQAQIENDALSLLAAYGRTFAEIAAPPIPVEEIIECHLNIDFRIENLPKMIGQPDVLGATWIEEQRIYVDESLDPTVFPEKEGRYRFTLSHEVGHWQLHRPYLLARANQGLLFAETKEPSIVCRIQSNRDPIEWQADTFAGYLLMPKEMVRSIWREVRGSTDPYLAVDEMAARSAGWSLAENNRPTIGVARDMARIFKVSGQAMQIRLTGLGLIQTQAAAPALFSQQ